MITEIWLVSARTLPNDMRKSSRFTLQSFVVKLLHKLWVTAEKISANQRRHTR